MRFRPVRQAIATERKAGFSRVTAISGRCLRPDRGEVGADVEHWTSFAPERLDTGMLERIFAPENWLFRPASNGRKRPAPMDGWRERATYREGLRDDLPLVLRRTDVRVDTYGFGGRGLCAAVCRRARAGLAPLSRQVVTAGALRDFLRQCLNGTKGGKTGA